MSNDQWLDLLVALAWICSRDRKVTFQVEQLGKRKVAAALDFLDQHQKEASPTSIDVSMAWLQLRDAISAGKVKARGQTSIGYFRVVDRKVEELPPNATRALMPGDDGEDLWEVEMEPSDALASEVSKLTLEIGAHRIELRPEDSIFSRKPSWREVVILQSALLVEFPAQAGPLQLGPQLDRVIEAMKAIYGETGPSSTQRGKACHTKIGDRMEKTHGHRPSTSTIQRAYKFFDEVKGR